MEEVRAAKAKKEKAEKERQALLSNTVQVIPPKKAVYDAAPEAPKPKAAKPATKKAALDEKKAGKMLEKVEKISPDVPQTPRKPASSTSSAKPIARPAPA
jgi:hypothetical protein